MRLVPAHAPPHDENTQPSAGVAVIVAAASGASGATQAVLQLRTPLESDTTPDPEIAVTVNCLEERKVSDGADE